MNAIQIVAERWNLGRIFEGAQARRVEATTRRTRRQFNLNLDALPPRIAPAVLIIPAEEPEPANPYIY